VGELSTRRTHLHRSQSRSQVASCLAGFLRLTRLLIKNREDCVDI